MQFKSLAYVLLGQSALVAAQSATTTAPAAAATCEPHEDHWHCPAGVPQPSTNPDGSVNTKATQGAGSASATQSDHDHDHDHDHDTTATVTASASGSATAATTLATTTTVATGPNGCTPHNDHWHCPSGVAKPTTPPPGYTPSATSAKSSVSGGSASPSATTTATPTAAAGRAGPLGISVVVGGSLLLGALFL